MARIRLFTGSVGLGQFPVGQILLHGAPARGSLDIVAARRNGVFAPYAARPSPGIEYFRIRFDDPVRVHRLDTRGTEAVHNHRDARRIVKSVRLLRSAVRPKTTTAPTSGPEHKLEAVLRPRRGRRTGNLDPSPTEIRIPSLTDLPWPIPRDTRHTPEPTDRVARAGRAH